MISVESRSPWIWYHSKKSVKTIDEAIDFLLKKDIFNYYE